METLAEAATDVIGYDPARTVPELFFERVRRSPDAVAYSEFHSDRWNDVSWQDVARKVGRIRAALDRAGMQPGDRVGILLRNCVDWIAFDLAAMANGLITVPMYLHDSAANNGHILAHCGVRLCFTDTQNRWLSLAACCAHCAELETVWVQQAPDSPSADERWQIEAFRNGMPGNEVGMDDIRCSAGDVATIINTSGTTGVPKGVMLSHRALLWNADAVTKFIPPLTSDVFLSVLPLAHAFERTMGYHIPLVGGARVAFSRSIQQLREDFAVVRPTVLIAVPRLYERIYEAVLNKISKSPLTKALTQRAAKIGWRVFEAGHGRARMPGSLTRRLVWPVLRRLVAKKVMMAFGGRLRVAVNGGAPLADPVSHFLIGLGLPLLEGYGLTEAAPVVTATTLKGNWPGSVGRALGGVELKTADSGELMVRSPSMMLGYWQEPEKTAGVLDDDGWLRTGDLAEIREGHVFIKGRLKEIIALSTGKKVAPTAVENRIERQPVFEQALVVGDERPCLVAVVVLNADNWASFAKELGVDKDDPNGQPAKQALLSDLSRATADLPNYAKIRAVHAVIEPWTTENGLLTPTLKIKRSVVESRFAEEIEALYAALKDSRTRHGL